MVDLIKKSVSTTTGVVDLTTVSTEDVFATDTLSLTGETADDTLNDTGQITTTIAIT